MNDGSGILSQFRWVIENADETKMSQIKILDKVSSSLENMTHTSDEIKNTLDHFYIYIFVVCTNFLEDLKTKPKVWNPHYVCRTARSLEWMQVVCNHWHLEVC